MLCQNCTRITLAGLRSYGGYQHASSFKALKSSAASCPVCAILWNAAVTNAGCETCSKDLLQIHEEPIMLEGSSGRDRTVMSYIMINSHGEDEYFSFPGRAYGKVALYVPPGTSNMPN